jgi:acetyl-CoA carboxylase biotin carboxyl carrier protein
MSFPSLDVLVRTAPDGGLELLSPGPGKIRWSRLRGDGLVGGSRVGLLRRDDRTYELVLPAGSAGRVKEILLSDPWTRCEHGQLLGRLGAHDSGTEVTGGDPGVSADPDGWSVRSPTHGTFYRRPGPGESAYVESGSAVVRGQTLGLVEVMKCFSPIVFDPPPGADRGTVVEILVGDSVEVQADQPLLRIDLGTGG